MLFRVRNLQPEGGSSLRICGHIIPPGFTSPVVEIKPSTPEDDVVTAWTHDGIASVHPAEEEAGHTGITHKKARKSQVFDVNQARAEAMKRRASGRTSLDASTALPEAPEVANTRSGGSTSLKARILKASDIQGRPEPITRTPLNTVASVTPEKIEYPAEIEPGEVIDPTKDEEAPPMTDPDEGMEAEDALMEEENEVNRSRALEYLEAELDKAKKPALLEKAAEVGIDVKPALLKAEIVQALALYVIDNVSADEQENFLQSL